MAADPVETDEAARGVVERENRSARAGDQLIVPLLKPTRPPAALFAPALTLPVAKDVLIVPAGILQPDEAADKTGVEHIAAVAAGDGAARDRDW